MLKQTIISYSGLHFHHALRGTEYKLAQHAVLSFYFRKENSDTFDGLFYKNNKAGLSAEITGPKTNGVVEQVCTYLPRAHPSHTRSLLSCLYEVLGVYS